MQFHLEMQRLLGSTQALLHQESSPRSSLTTPAKSPRLSRAGSEVNSVVSYTSRRPTTGPNLFPPSLRAARPSDAESLQLDRPSFRREPSRLSLRDSKESAVTFNPGTAGDQKQSLLLDTPPSLKSSALLGGRPSAERRSSSPGAITRLRGSFDGASSPSLMQRSSSVLSQPARPSTAESLAEVPARPTSSPESRRRTTFGTTLAFEAPAGGSQLFSIQPTARPRSPLRTESKGLNWQSSIGPGLRGQSSSGMLSPRLPVSPSTEGDFHQRSLSSVSRLNSPSNGLAGKARVLGSQSARTRAQDEELNPPEIKEWQTIAEEVRDMLEDSGNAGRQEIEQHLAELNVHVKKWDGLLEGVVQKFEKSLQEALKGIFSRARSRVQLNKEDSLAATPASDKGSPRKNLARPKQLQISNSMDDLHAEPSFESPSMARSSSSQVPATVQQLAVMPSPPTLPPQSQPPPHVPYFGQTDTPSPGLQNSGSQPYTQQPMHLSAQPHSHMQPPTYPSIQPQPHTLQPASVYGHPPMHAPYFAPHTQLYGPVPHVGSKHPGAPCYEPNAMPDGGPSSPPHTHAGPTPQAQHHPSPAHLHSSSVHSAHANSAHAHPHSTSHAHATSPRHKHHSLPVPPPQLAGSAAAQLWLSFASSKAYTPYSSSSPGNCAKLHS